jgi:hypothetical protein
MHTHIAHARDTRMQHQKSEKKMARILRCFASGHHFRPLPSSFLLTSPLLRICLCMRTRLGNTLLLSPGVIPLFQLRLEAMQDVCRLKASKSIRPSVPFTLYPSVCPCQSVLSPAYIHSFSLTLSPLPPPPFFLGFFLQCILQPVLNVGPGGVLVGIELYSIELN